MEAIESHSESESHSFIILFTYYFQTGGEGRGVSLANCLQLGYKARFSPIFTRSIYAINEQHIPPVPKLTH